MQSSSPLFLIDFVSEATASTGCSISQISLVSSLVLDYGPEFDAVLVSLSGSAEFNRSTHTDCLRP